MSLHTKLPSLLSISSHILVSKVLVKKLGLNTAFFLASLMNQENYLALKRLLTKEGYFYFTRADLVEVTGLPPETQLSIENQLVELKMLRIKVVGIPARNQYKIDEEQVNRYKKTFFHEKTLFI